MGKAVSVFMDICRLNSHASPLQSLHFPPLRKRPFRLCTVNTSFQEISLSNMFLFLCPYFKELLSLRTILVLVYWVLASRVTALLHDTIARRHLLKQGSFGDALGEYSRALAPAGAAVAVCADLCARMCMHTWVCTPCKEREKRKQRETGVLKNRRLLRLVALLLKLLSQDKLHLNIICD